MTSAAATPEQLKGEDWAGSRGASGLPISTGSRG